MHTDTHTRACLYSAVGSGTYGPYGARVLSILVRELGGVLKEPRFSAAVEASQATAKKLVIWASAEANTLSLDVEEAIGVVGKE